VKAVKNRDPKTIVKGAALVGGATLFGLRIIGEHLEILSKIREINRENSSNKTRGAKT